MSRPQPEDLSPREARDLYLDKRRTDATDHTLQTDHYRLKTVVQWAEEEDIQRVSELTGWEIDRFEADRRAQDVAPTTITGSMSALKKLLEYCARIEAIDSDLPEKVDVPSPWREEQSNE